MNDQVKEADEATSEGVRARRVLLLKQFVPSQDFIQKTVIAGGKGTQVILARIFGVAMESELKHNTIGDKVVPSIVLRGAFQGESYVTGEVTEATSVYLPMAYAEKVYMIFAEELAAAKKEERLPSPLAIEIDCDVGLEATGKMIPYEWVVIAYREGAEMAALKRLKGLRGRPKNAALPTPAAQAQIEGPKSETTAQPAKVAHKK